MDNKNSKRRIIIHNSDAFIKALNQMNNGERPFAELNSKDFEIPFFDIPPIEGYVAPRNKDTGEQFPKCCDHHKDILKVSNEWFKKFPDCCDAHRNLLKASWFKKKNYRGVGMKIVTQISFTAHQIETQIGKPDWYKDITDYIHYNVSSFGQLPTGHGNPVGLHIYLNELKHWVTKFSNVSNDKIQKIVEYIDDYYQPSITHYKTDLNALFLIYQKWLSVFPFDISYFSEQKQYFSKQLPILSGQHEYNKYLGVSSAEVQTQAGLIEALTNRTKQLLQKIDTSEWVEKNLITDKDKHRLQLISAAHRIKQSSLVNEFSLGEMEYMNVLAKWLDNEKQYFADIKPLINYTPPTKSLSAFEELPKETAQFILKMLDDLSITNGEKYQLGERGQGTIRGIVEALEEVAILPSKQIHSLIKIIAKKIEMPLKSDLSVSDTSNKYKKRALDYIKKYYKK